MSKHHRRLFITFALAPLAACGSVPYPKARDGGGGSGADGSAAGPGDGGAGWAWVDAGPVVPPQGMLGDPVAVQAGDDTFVFALDQAGAAAVSITGPDRSRPWHALGGQLAGKPAVILNGTGAPQLFARAHDGTIATTKLTADRSGFTAWSALRVPGSGAGGDPSVVRWMSHYLALFVRDGEGSVWGSWQTGDTNDPGWRAWTKLTVSDAFPMMGRPSAVVSLGDYVYLAWRGQDRKDVHLIWGIAPQLEAGWQGHMLGPADPPLIAADPYLGYSSGGLLYVAALASDATIVWSFQQIGLGGWTNWLASGGKCQGQPSILPTRNGGVQAFCRGAGGALETMFLPVVEATFPPWSAINSDVKLAGDPYAIMNRDGAIQVFARDEAGRVVSTVQSGTSTGAAGFTRWAPLGQP